MQCRMKRFIKIFSAIVAVALVAASCTEKDVAQFLGVSKESSVSASLTGSYKGFDNKLFESNSGTYQRNDHPQITIHEDDTFSFNFERTINAKSGDYVLLRFDWSKIPGTLEIGKVYSLYLPGEHRASLDIVDRKDDVFVTTTYNAVNGWIVFTNKKAHSGGFLFSGEFRFEAETAEGDKVKVDDGLFTDCRICWGDDHGCAAY